MSLLLSDKDSLPGNGAISEGTGLESGGDNKRAKRDAGRDGPHRWQFEVWCNNSFMHHVRYVTESMQLVLLMNDVSNICDAVLGRGFHLDDIRFVFHACLPMSLSNYIQQTGRGGRDGKPSYAILFYRAQDHSVVERIRDQPENAVVEHDNIVMMRYCTQGKVCRYSLLSSHATPSLGCQMKMQKCKAEVRCDNCKDSLSSEQVDMRAFVTRLLWLFKQALARNNILPESHVPGLICEALSQTLKDAARGDQLYPLLIGDFRTSLRGDLIRLLTWLKVVKLSYHSYEIDEGFETFLKQIEHREISVLLKGVGKATFVASEKEIILKRGSQVLDVEENHITSKAQPDDADSVDPACHGPASSFVPIPDSLCQWLDCVDELPFLLQFEVLR